MTAMSLFGGAVVISIGTVAVSTVLHIMGKGELDGFLTGAAQLTMLVMLLAGVYEVLHLMISMFGMNLPVGWEVIDKVFPSIKLPELFK